MTWVTMLFVAGIIIWMAIGSPMVVKEIGMSCINAASSIQHGVSNASEQLPKGGVK